MLTRLLAIAVTAVLASGCAAVAEQSAAKRDTAIFLDGDRLHTGTGATISSGSGNVEGGNTTAQKKAP